MGTRTGGFKIGMRRGWSEWQRDLPTLTAWASASGFDAIDLGGLSPEDAVTVKEAGLSLGSVDLVDSGNILSPDPEKRKTAIERNVNYVKDAASNGASIFFTCIIPHGSGEPRDESYKLAVESFGPIIQAITEVGGHMVIEGYPGGKPHLPSLCCTPETMRQFLKDFEGQNVGINYDPSHLIRLGVDHIRFLKEFGAHVYYVHGKDTEIDTEAIYEYGLYQNAAFAKGHGFGEWVWRYTIPGSGQARWSEIFRILQDNGYQGNVSVELEDENFNGTEAGEKSGLLHSLEFLRSA